MKIEAVKTRLVHAGEISLENLLEESLTNFAKKSGKEIHEILPEKSIIVLSSKVAGLCENRVIKQSEIDRDELIQRESEYYLDPSFSSYGHLFTINGNTLVSKAGIDVSNIGDDLYVLWPKDLFGLANRVRKFLREKYDINDLGVIIIDSVSSPMRRGVKGEMLSWSGFEAVNNYVGEKDLFGREFQIEMSGVGVSLAIAANIVMGEGAERSPIGIISDTDFVKFVSRDPTQEDIEQAFVPFDQDVFMPFLTMMPWKKGGNYDNRIVKQDIVPETQDSSFK